MATHRVCEIEGCGKPAAKRGFCAAHYKRLIRYGSPTAGAAFRERQGGPCVVEGCDRPAATKGHCSSHYARIKRAGTAGGPIERFPVRGPCSAEGCNHVGPLKRGLCTKHHHRLLRHGDVSIRLRAAAGERAAWVRENAGHQGDECLIWPFPRNRHGYGTVDVAGVKMVASRYMCIEAHGPPEDPGLHAAHSCGRGSSGCVNPRHLRWATVEANAADKVAHGTAYRGERHWKAKLTEADVLHIRSLLGTMTQAAIADAYGVNRCLVSEIKTGRKWGWLK